MILGEAIAFSPSRGTQTSRRQSLDNFEKIAKEVTHYRYNSPRTIVHVEDHLFFQHFSKIARICHLYLILP